MMRLQTGCYWRLCWGLFAPVILILVLAYSLISYEALTYKGHEYPTWAVGECGAFSWLQKNCPLICVRIFAALGWTISAMGIVQLPLWALWAILRQKQSSLSEKFAAALKPTKTWGPTDPLIRQQYEQGLGAYESSKAHQGCTSRLKRNLFG